MSNKHDLNDPLSFVNTRTGDIFLNIKTTRLWSLATAQSMIPWHTMSGAPLPTPWAGSACSCAPCTPSRACTAALSIGRRAARELTRQDMRTILYKDAGLGQHKRPTLRPPGRR
jgi:hypothetical protein